LNLLYWILLAVIPKKDILSGSDLGKDAVIEIKTRKGQAFFRKRLATIIN
jgi:hypothetical protein